MQIQYTSSEQSNIFINNVFEFERTIDAKGHGTSNPHYSFQELFFPMEEIGLFGRKTD